MLPALLLALALLPNPALAYQSFTASLSFYQGLNLTTGMTAFDPRILTLIINPSAHVNLVLSPESEPNLFHFSPDINLYFSYDPTHAAPITLTPHALQGVAVLSGADATAITPAMLAGLSFITTPVAIGADDLAMLWLKDSAYMVFERVTQLPDWTVQVDYRQIQAVPEPSAAILMGVGGLIIIVIRTSIRTYQKEKHL